MNRDFVIQVVVGVEAQLRRIEQLSRSIGDPVEHKVRIPPLITESRRQLESLRARLQQIEGGK